MGILNSRNKSDVSFLISAALFPITREQCAQQNGHNYYAVAAL